MTPSDGKLFITTDAVGGVWSYSVALARGMAAEGRHCVLAVLGPAPGASQRAAIAEIAGCELLETGLQLDWVLSSYAEIDALARGLARYARDVGANTAHLHAPVLASVSWTMPIVVVAHSCMATWWYAVRSSALPSDIAWHAEATAKGLKAAEAVVAPSAAFAQALGQAYQINRPVQVIYNGLSGVTPHAIARADFVLAAGRLWDEAKNLATLDKAAALLEMPVRVAGPLAAPGGAPAAFQHLDHLGNLPAAELTTTMAQAAIFVAPSVYEPFGLGVLEAAQQATPLVLADIPTFRELWSDAALFVSALDPIAWADCLDTLMRDADKRQVLGQAALLRARCYSQDAMVSATAAIHHGLGMSVSRAA